MLTKPAEQSTEVQRSPEAINHFRCFDRVHHRSGSYILAPTLAEYVFRKPEAAPVIRAFAPAFPLYAVALVGDGITRLSQRKQYSAYSNIGSMAFALMLFCILFSLGCGVRGAVIATVGGIAVGALISIISSEVSSPRCSRKKSNPNGSGERS